MKLQGLSDLDYALPGLAAAVFAIALLSVCAYMRFNAGRRLLLGTDINKKDMRKIPEGTGIALLVPIWAGIAFLAFSAQDVRFIALGILASAFAIMGLWDDAKQKFAGKTMPPDLSRTQIGAFDPGGQIAWIIRAALAAGAALVFAVVYSPSAYWIIPIALFIAGAASFQNTFAGLNGWEVGSGFIISIGVLHLLWQTPLMPLALVLSAAVLALLLWNAYPAKVFPGDSGTLLIGSGIAGLMVLNGNIALMAMTALLFIPHIIDFALKALTNPKDMSQAKSKPYVLLADGRLSLPETLNGKRTYDFAKLLLRVFGPMKEWQVVAIIWLIVAANAIAVLFLFGMI